MMNELVDLLKKRMGYTNKEVKCSLCDHFIETTKGRGEFLCQLNGAMPIEVDPEGRCDFFSDRRETFKKIAIKISEATNEQKD